MPLFLINHSSLHLLPPSSHSPAGKETIRKVICEQDLKQADESVKGKGRADEKVYRGMNVYTDYKAGFRREQTVSGEKAVGAHGLLRALAKGEKVREI